jgi:hypothetical protein
MMDRREFFQSALAASLCLGFAPRLGRVWFCRVSHEGLLRLVPSGCIAEVDPVTEGLTFLGSHATLIVNRSGWRLFPANEVQLLP